MINYVEGFTLGLGWLDVGSGSHCWGKGKFPPAATKARRKVFQRGLSAFQVARRSHATYYLLSRQSTSMKENNMVMDLISAFLIFPDYLQQLFIRQHFPFIERASFAVRPFHNAFASLQVYGKAL